MAKTPYSKPTDVRLKTQDELGDALVVLAREQFNLRFQRATGQTQATGRMREVRREIARVKTILAEKKRSAATS